MKTSFRLAASDLAALRFKIGARLVVASVSGGKDSAALSLWLKENEIEHRRVLMDTGWEHWLTYHHALRREQMDRRAICFLNKWTEAQLDAALDDADRRYGGEAPLQKELGQIESIRAHRTMLDLIRKRGMFPSKRRRFCTQELKVFVMQRFLKALVAGGQDAINAVGIRRAESAGRSSALEWEWSRGFDVEVWRPLVNWSEQDVIDIHARHGLKPNPLYLQGASRVGCWPCIYARKSEIRHIAETDPVRIDVIEALEEEISVAAFARWEKRVAEWKTNPPAPTPEPIADDFEDDDPSELGEDDDLPMTAEEKFEAAHEEWQEAEDFRLNGPKPFSKPAWFQSQTGKSGACVPIRKVVEWSKTSRGGKQFEMFAASEADAGCMRWGLCETNSNPRDEQ